MDLDEDSDEEENLLSSIIEPCAVCRSVRFVKSENGEYICEEGHVQQGYAHMQSEGQQSGVRRRTKKVHTPSKRTQKGFLSFLLLFSIFCKANIKRKSWFGGRGHSSYDKNH